MEEKKVLTEENVLGDSIAYVSMINWMGDDFTPAEDARMSTMRGRKTPVEDERLMRRLQKDNHTSPFEGVVIKMEVCGPLYAIREIDRHRSVKKGSEKDQFDYELVLPEEGARCWMARNEASGRYIKLPAQYHHPIDLRPQKLGQSITDEVKQEFLTRGKKLTADARELYDWAVANGIENGQARIYNTQNQYTWIRYTGSLKNWFDLLYLRLPSDVQGETRKIAQALERLIGKVFPVALKLWKDNTYKTLRISQLELEALVDSLNNSNEKSAVDLLRGFIGQIKNRTGE